MDCASSFKVVVTDLHFISQLFTAEDQSHLVNHDTFFFLESLLHLEDGVVRVEVEALSLAS